MAIQQATDCTPVETARHLAESSPADYPFLKPAEKSKDSPVLNSRKQDRVSWSMIRKSFSRPYPVTGSMLLLAMLVPGYLVIAYWTEGRPASKPSLALDDWVPLIPDWVLVYAGLYLFLIILPVIVIWQRELIDRTVRAYLLVWLVSFGIFLIYPTVIQRADIVPGDDFFSWSLRRLYEADTAFNCFPSIHVAHSIVSALACFRVHRWVGIFALGCASLVALSTLFIKQHFVVDVVVGALLALLGYRLFLQAYPREHTSPTQYRLAPHQLWIAGGFVCLVIFWVWIVFRFADQSV